MQEHLTLLDSLVHKRSLPWALSRFMKVQWSVEIVACYRAGNGLVRLPAAC